MWTWFQNSIAFLHDLTFLVTIANLPACRYLRTACVPDRPRRNYALCLVWVAFCSRPEVLHVRLPVRAAVIARQCNCARVSLPPAVRTETFKPRAITAISTLSADVQGLRQKKNGFFFLHVTHTSHRSTVAAQTT